MANFPQNPSVNDTHQINDKIWTWDGEKWFADYEALSPVFQAINAQGMVDRDGGSAFELAVDADILTELGHAAPDIIGNVIITGDNNPVVGTSKTYSFAIDGNVSDEVGTFTCDVPDAIVIGNQIEFPTIGTGKVYVVVNSATATDSPVNASMDIDVVAAPITDTIGNVTIGGDLAPTEGDTVTYSYSIDGDASDDVGVLTTNIAGATVNGNDIEFTQAGTGYIQYEVSATATDSPVTKQETVNVAAAPLIDIGGIVISGDRTPNLNDTVTYGYTISGSVNDSSIKSLTTTVPGATVNGNDITYGSVGSGEVVMEIESPTATDSPVTSTINVDVQIPGWGDPNSIKIIGEANPTITGSREYSYEFVFNGNVPDATYSWSISPQNMLPLSGSTNNPQSFYAQAKGQSTITCVATSSTYGVQTKTFDVDISDTVLVNQIIGDAVALTGTSKTRDNTYQINYDGNATSYQWELISERTSYQTFTYSDSTQSSYLLSIDGREDTYMEMHVAPSTNAQEQARTYVGVDAFPDENGYIEILAEWVSGMPIEIVGPNKPDGNQYSYFYPAVQTPGKQWIAPTNLANGTANWSKKGSSGNDYHTLAYIQIGSKGDGIHRFHAIKVNDTIINLGTGPSVNSLTNQDMNVQFRTVGDYIIRCTVEGDNGTVVAEKDVTVGRGNETVVVTVKDDGTGDKFYINDSKAAAVNLQVGRQIIFDQEVATNSGHPIKIYKQPNKVDEVVDDGTVTTEFYREGIFFTEGLAKFNPTTAGTYYYECANHSNMGGVINVN